MRCGVLEEVNERMWAGPRQLEVPHSLSCPWNVHSACLPHPRSFPRTQPWNRRVLLRPSRWNMWLNPVKFSINTLRFSQVGAKIYSFCGAQDNPHMEVPLFIKPATYQPGVTCIFLWSLPALCGWGWFQIIPGQLLRLQTNKEPGFSGKQHDLITTHSFALSFWFVLEFGNM